jgi:mRNA-degrading endonuclease RelE of RelBE toxin-antitoxin system
MGFIYTPHFKRAYKRMTKDAQDKLKSALRRLEDDPRHPSLHTEKVRGTKGSDIMAARLSDDMRFTFEIQGDDIVLRTVGAHDDVYRNP